MKKTVRIFVLIAISLCINCLMSACSREPEYDNLAMRDAVITQQYSAESVDRFAKKSQERNLDYSDLKAHFKIECLRKTHQGYYAVLLLDDNSTAFIFMDQQLQVTKVLQVDKFLSKNDFELLCNGDNPLFLDDVLSMDPNAILSPVSIVIETAHIVQEGVVVVTYSNFEDGKLLDYTIAKSIKFFDNDALLNPENHYLLMRMPYILPIDRE